MNTSENIYLRLFGEKRRCYVTKFPGGEINVQLPFRCGEDHVDNPVIQIVAAIKGSDDIMELLLTTDALRREFEHPVLRVVIPYFPYARQDRVCNPGEAFSLRVMANLINSQDYHRVTVLDPHSTVLAGMLDNARMVEQYDIMFDQLYGRIVHLAEDEGANIVLVAPDAGAAKKTEQLVSGLVQFFPNITMITASKRRNLATGDIIETVVPNVDLSGKYCIIADDICDGGRTFIELAKKLKSQDAKEVHLWVTHGIFSKGLKVFEGLIEEVRSTRYVLPEFIEHVDGVKFIQIKV